MDFGKSIRFQNGVVLLLEVSYFVPYALYMVWDFFNTETPSDSCEDCYENN